MAQAHVDRSADLGAAGPAFRLVRRAIFIVFAPRFKISRGSAVRPQQYFRQPSELGATGGLTSVFIEQPAQLDLTNAEVAESGLQANSSAFSR